MAWDSRESRRRTAQTSPPAFLFSFLGTGPFNMPARKSQKSRPASDSGSPTFIHVTDPTDGSWRRAVRSQAATARHAAARRRRLLDHEDKAKDLQTPGAVSQMSFLPSPENVCRLRAVDPFDTLARPTTRFESFLVDHCKPLRPRSPIILCR